MELPQDILKTEYQFIKVLCKTDTTELTVYRHKTLDKSLAVLTLQNPANLTVYQRLQQISHHNIMQVYDVIQSKQTTMVFCEFIDGIPLSQVGIMKPLGVKRILLQLCDGLHALHSIGIIHRDITLSNLMLDHTGTLKIIDFDIAKAYSNDATTENTLGTVRFAPPEQFGFAITDERSDIYSVGVAANLLLTGEHPSKCIYKPHSKLGKAIVKATNTNMENRFQSISAFQNSIL